MFEERRRRVVDDKFFVLFLTVANVLRCGISEVFWRA
jgi:hypothetical protein